MIALMTASREQHRPDHRRAGCLRDPLEQHPAIVLVHLAAFVLIVIAAWLLAPTGAAATVPSGARPELTLAHWLKGAVSPEGLTRLGRPGPA
ncbi:MAG: hypothetical protein WAN22_11940 [Solirubrobacteraceae bacterium]